MHAVRTDGVKPLRCALVQVDSYHAIVGSSSLSGLSVELDRFTDEQCLRFVRAANRGFWRTLGRVVLITVVSAALLVGGVVASAYVTSAFDRFESKRLGVRLGWTRCGLWRRCR